MTTQEKTLARIQGIVSENSRLASDNARLQAQIDAIHAAMGMTPTLSAPARKAKTTKKAVNSSVAKARKTRTPARKASKPVDVKILSDMGGTMGYLADGMAYAVTYDRAYTWVYFQAKPSREICDLLGKDGLGGIYTHKRGPDGGWMFPRIIQSSEFAMIMGA